MYATVLAYTGKVIFYQKHTAMYYWLPCTQFLRWFVPELPDRNHPGLPGEVAGADPRPEEGEEVPVHGRQLRHR